MRMKSRVFTSLQDKMFEAGLLTKEVRKFVADGSVAPSNEDEAASFVKNPKALRKLLRTLNMSEEELAVKSGVRLALVKDIIRGKVKTYSNTTKKVSSALIGTSKMSLADSLQSKISLREKLDAEIEADTNFVESLINSASDAAEVIPSHPEEKEPTRKLDTLESNDIHLVSENESSVENTATKSAGGFMDARSDLLKYIRKNSSDEKMITSALVALDLLRDEISRGQGEGIKRDLLLDSSTSLYWQLSFLAGITERGYVKRYGVKRATRYVPTKLLLEPIPRDRELAKIVWPERFHDGGSEALEEFDQEPNIDTENIESSLESSIDTEDVESNDDSVPDVVEATSMESILPVSDISSIEGRIQAMENSFIQAMEGQLHVALSQTDQIGRIEKDLAEVKGMLSLILDHMTGGGK